MKVSIYLRLASLLLALGEVQIAGAITRCVMEGLIHSSEYRMPTIYASLREMAIAGDLRNPLKNETKRAYGRCSGALHGRNIHPDSIRKAIVTTRRLTVLLKAVAS